MAIETVIALLMVGGLAFLALIAASPGPIGDRVRRSGRRSGSSPGGGLSDAAPSIGIGVSASSEDAPAAVRSRDLDVGDVTAHMVDPGAGAASSGSKVRAGGPGDPDGDAGRRLGEVPRQDGADGSHADLRPAALERVIRVGTWVFLFTATAFVTATQLWAAQQGLILIVLAAAAISTFVLHEFVGGRNPTQRVLVVEVAVGLTFASALVALTGGAMSLFYAALPLIVVGAAIVVTPGVTLALTAAAGIMYLVAILVAGTTGLGPLEIATAGINLTVLCLVAYVGTAIGREQRRAREDAKRLATIDSLTGLHNRGSLFDALERELDRSRRTGRGFCLLMIDLDDLKDINDRHGHLVGDRALQAVGEVIRRGTRSIDTGARFGGDEFVVLLPETDPTGGWVLAEKIRQGVREARLTVGGSTVRTSVSVGLAASPQDGETADVLLERADGAMYRSKRAGRDRVTGVPVMDADSVRTTAPAGGDGNPV